MLKLSLFQKPRMSVLARSQKRKLAQLSKMAALRVAQVAPGTTQRLNLSFSQDQDDETLQVTFPAVSCLKKWPLKKLISDLVKSASSDAPSAPMDLQVNFSGPFERNLFVSRL